MEAALIRLEVSGSNGLLLEVLLIVKFSFPSNVLAVYLWALHTVVSGIVDSSSSDLREFRTGSGGVGHQNGEAGRLCMVVRCLHAQC